MGCEACEQNLEAEIESKDEEDMTEQEKALLRGEMEAPFAYGPIADWDGSFCKFCHSIGQVMALVIGLGIIFYATRTDVDTSVTSAMGVIVYLILMITVAYLGRFPILGATFGPMFEYILASWFGICPTESAKKKYNCGTHKGHQMERDLTRHGPEMHIVATDWAKDNCVDIDEPGALKRVEINNGQIVDVHAFHPNRHFNRFSNINDQVGVDRENLCKGKKEPVTILEFVDLIESQGREGFS